MKILILILCLFIPNIYASEDGIFCSYKVDNKTISFNFFVSSSGNGVVINFVVDGEDYSFQNKITSPAKLECPAVGQVNLYGDNYTWYYLADDEEQLKALINEDKTIENQYGDIQGQVEEFKTASKTTSTEYPRYDYEEINASDLSYKTKKQMDANIKSYSKGSCTAEEKTAIYNYFNTNDFNGLGTFFGDNTFSVDGEYIKLGNECASIAQTLYNSVIGLGASLADYASSDNSDIYTLAYLSLYESYSAGYSALTSYWVNLDISDNACDAISEDVRNILNSFFDTFRLICVILVTFLTYLDGMKCLSAKSDDATKKWISNSIKRMIVLVLALLLPLLVNIILDLVDKYRTGNYEKVNGECVKVITGS